MDGDNIYLATLALFWLFLCGVAGKIASNKDRSFGWFFILAFLLSPLVGIISAVVATSGAQVPNYPRSGSPGKGRGSSAPKPGDPFRNYRRVSTPVREISLDQGETHSGTDAEKVRVWSVILHLSMLTGVLVPVLGFILPVVIYLLKRNQVPELKIHATNIFNWLISVICYCVVALFTTVILNDAVSLYLVTGLMLLSLIFSAIGAIKAITDTAWPYPLSIKFFK